MIREQSDPQFDPPAIRELSASNPIRNPIRQQSASYPPAIRELSASNPRAIRQQSASYPPAIRELSANNPRTIRQQSASNPIRNPIRQIRELSASNPRAIRELSAKSDADRIRMELSLCGSGLDQAKVILQS
ncbi:hypothetical protein MVEG_01565 [Podila verticillata NRRL 6337]|nr:hypothetical protein MVEG_01565 [Podila verticillata NRRL 6337]